MRIVFKLKLLGNMIIPTTYRKNFTALIKECFAKSGDAELAKLNESKGQKPFTFSVDFSVSASTKGFLELASDEFEFYFSTNDYAVLTAVYNYMLKNLDNYKIFANTQNVFINAALLKSETISSDSVVFRTLSPILVRDMANSDGDKTLKWDEDGFVDNLKLSIKSTVKAFIGDEMVPSEIKIIQMRSDNIMSFGNKGQRHYGVYGNSGIIEIGAKPEYLQLLYDVGIGGKRSQGFGMVEVLGGE